MTEDGTYSFTVRFTRSLSDDLQLCHVKERLAKGASNRDALKQQFVAELEEICNASTPGAYEVLSGPVFNTSRSEGLDCRKRITDANDVDSRWDVTVRASDVYEYTVRSRVVQITDEPLQKPLPQDYTEEKRVALEVDGTRYVIDYEVIPAQEVKRQALLVSAREKLTEEEFNAVMYSRSK